MIVRTYIMGKCYTIDLTPCDGYCTDPNGELKRILIPKGLKNTQNCLETITHEVLHAAQFSSPEDKVEKISRDLAKILWKLGWRLKDEA